MIHARITSIQAHFMDYELKLIGQPDQAELKKEFKQAIGQEEEETPPQPVKVKNIFDHLKEFLRRS